jgi:hypothetical protein
MIISNTHCSYCYRQSEYRLNLSTNPAGIRHVPQKYAFFVKRQKFLRKSNVTNRQFHLSMTNVRHNFSFNNALV